MSEQNKMDAELLPCPFCGDVPQLPSGDGTQYEIECVGCGQAMASVQICDLMTIEERAEESFSNSRYQEQYVERARIEATKRWNERASLPVGVPDGWWQLIHDTLKDYRMHTLSDGDGGGYPLIDAMTADGQSVSGGIEECTYLVDAIWNALTSAAPAAPTVKESLSVAKQEAACTKPDCFPYCDCGGVDDPAPTVKAEQVKCGTCNDTALIGDLPIECPDCCHDAAPSLPAAGSSDLTAVRCQCCATEYPHDSYDAGFIAGSGMCQVCDAAIPPKDLPAAGSAVEEPTIVAYGDPKAFKNLRIDGHKGAPYNHEWMWAAPAPGLVPMIELEQHNRIDEQRLAEIECLRKQSVADKAAMMDAHHAFIRQLEGGICTLVKERDAALSAQQSAPERVSVPVELLRSVCSNLPEKMKPARRELRALLASHAEGGKV